jgi:hypothetical protein
MAITAFRDTKPFPQLIFSAFVILVCFLAFMVLSLIVALPFFGIDSVMNIGQLNDFSNPEHITVLKYFQTVQAIGLFIVPPLIIAYLFQGKPVEYLHLNRSFNSSTLLLVIVLMFSAGPFINLIGELNNNMVFPDWLAGVERWMKNSEENAALITEAFLDVNSVGGLAFNLFMIALLPAIGEEFLFRGVIQKIFTNMTKNHHWGIWISAILFSTMHLQFYGFVPRVVLGAAFGYLLVWSGSMWLPVVGHFLNNALAVIGMYFINKGSISSDFEEMGSTTDSYYLAAISLVLIIVFMLIIKKQNTERQLLIPDK